MAAFSGPEVDIAVESSPTAFTNIVFARIPGTDDYVAQSSANRKKFAFSADTVPADIDPADPGLTCTAVNTVTGAVTLSPSNILGATEILSSASGKTPLVNLVSVGNDFNGATLNIEQPRIDITTFKNKYRQFHNGIKNWNVEGSMIFKNENFSIGSEPGHQYIGGDPFILALYTDEPGLERMIGRVQIARYSIVNQIDDVVRAQVVFDGVKKLYHRSSGN